MLLILNALVFQGSDPAAFPQAAGPTRHCRLPEQGLREKPQPSVSRMSLCRVVSGSSLFPKHVTLNALPRLFLSRRNPATSSFWRLLHFPLALPIQPVARLARLCALPHCQRRTTQTTSVIHPPGHSQGGEPWPVPCSGGGVTVDSISCV